MNYFGFALLHSLIGSKFSRHFFNQSEVKPKLIVARACTFFRALCRLRVIGLSPSFLIGQSNYFGFGLIRLKTALIDNIFTNYVTQNIFNGIIVNDISDHLPVLAFFKNDRLPFKPWKENVLRDFGEKNLLKFQTQLSLNNWSNVLNDQDPDS